MENRSLFCGLPEPDSQAFRGLIAFCRFNESRVLSSLPWVAAEIAASGGFTAMLRLIRRSGGTKIYVPHNRSKCTVKFGIPLTEAVHDRLIVNSDAKGFIDLPSAWGVFMAIRRVAIALAVEDGDPDKTITRHFGVTDRYLRQRKQKSKL